MTKLFHVKLKLNTVRNRIEVIDNFYIKPHHANVKTMSTSVVHLLNCININVDKYNDLALEYSKNVSTAEMYKNRLSNILCDMKSAEKPLDVETSKLDDEEVLAKMYNVLSRNRNITLELTNLKSRINNDSANLSVMANTTKPKIIKDRIVPKIEKATNKVVSIAKCVVTCCSEDNKVTTKSVSTKVDIYA